MSRSSYEGFETYGKKVMPPTWRSILIPNRDSLLFLGKDNLELILEEWTCLLRGAECYIRRINEGGYRKSYKARYDYLVERRKNAGFAISEIEKVLPTALSKPIITTHRPIVGYFSPDEDVYSTLGMKGILLPGKFVRQDIRDDYVALSGEYEGANIRVSHYSPLILKVNDLKYLASNGNYLSLFARASGFNYDEGADLYIKMINDRAKKDFPDLQQFAEPSLEIV